jgi:hypothetical protein
VIVHHADPAERVRWVEALTGEFEVYEASDPAELASLLETPAEVVVSAWVEGLPEPLMSGKSGARFLHVGPDLPSALVDAAERGLDVRHVSRVEELRSKVKSLTRPSRSSRPRRAVDGMRARWRGSVGAHRLVEVSSEGFSFRVEEPDDLESLLPGTTLYGVEILRGPTRVISDVEGLVRHVRPLPGPRSSYLIGCAFRVAANNDQPRSGRARPVAIRDSARIAVLVRAALRGDGLLLSSEDTGLALPRAAGQVDLERNRVVFSADARVAEYEVVRGSFELAGRVYRFLTAVTSAEPFTLRLPATIEETQSRTAVRIRPPESARAQARIGSALLPRARWWPLRDLSSTGLSIDVETDRDPVPPGLHVELQVRMEGRELACRGQVKHVALLPERPGWTRCGIAFTGLDEAERTALADLIMHSRFPSLEDGSGLHFDELWQFFLDTQFIYPKKRAALEPSLPALKRTLEALHARPNPLFKSVVCRDGGRVVGHVSGIRAYRRTWLSQHLAAVPGRQAGPMLNLGQAEYFGQSVDLEYFKIYFRPDNRWPARVFGGFASSIRDKQLSDLRTYAYYALATDTAPPADRTLTVSEASDEELALVERHLMATESPLIVRSDDLTRRSLKLEELDASYRALGLERRREVLMASRNGEPVGFALLELSSPGLNLSELLSSHRLYLRPAGAGAPDLVRHALLGAVLARYRAAGRPLAVGLASVEDAAQLARLGVEAEKRYCVWTCHRSLYERFCDHVDRMVAQLKARRERHHSYAQNR